MIEVENLSKYFGPVMAVDRISFAVGQGEIVGFLGLNGAGKTTTMRILTSFLPATSGIARVAGFARPRGADGGDHAIADGNVERAADPALEAVEDVDVGNAERLDHSHIPPKSTALSAEDHTRGRARTRRYTSNVAD